MKRPRSTQLSKSVVNFPGHTRKDKGRFDQREEADLELIKAAPDMAEALQLARRYVVGAYECAFPDAAENEAVLALIDAALLKAGL